MRAVSVTLILFLLPTLFLTAHAEERDRDLSPSLRLNSLIEIALKENHDLLMAKSGIDVSQYRIPQIGALPDPMVMIGYENEGWSRYTYGEMPGARWILGVSQMFPWPEKLSTKRLIAKKDTESIKSVYEKTKLNIIEELKVKYYELLFAYKAIDSIEEKIKLLEMVEEIVSSRYTAGMSPLAEFIMAQTEKYMAMEQKVMFKQRIKSVESMINSMIGRDPMSPLGMPEDVISERIELDENLLIERAMDSPEIKEGMDILESKEYKYRLAKLEYYPDITLSAEFSLKPEPYEDMWMVSASLNIPLFYRTKQRNMVLEAKAEVDEASHRLEAVRQMLKVNIIDALSMLRASEELILLYRDTLIPRAEQGLDTNISAYRTGKIELMQVLKALNSLIDYRLNYWRQVVERERVLARLERLSGGRL